jgi:hypothetical protein
MPDTTNYVFSEVIKGRKRFQAFYRIFLCIYILFGGYIGQSIKGVGWLFLPVLIILLIFEMNSGLFGRKNIFGGRLRLDDEPPKQNASVLQHGMEINFTGPIHIAFKRQIFLFIFLFLCSMLPFLGLIKQLILWQKDSFSLLHILPILWIGIFVVFISRYLLMAIVLDRSAIHISGMFKAQSIPYTSITRIRLIDLMSYWFRYTTYIEILTDRPVFKMPIESVVDFPSLKANLEIRIGNEIRY